MQGVNALPVAGGAFPSERIALPCRLVKRSASKQHVLIEVGMTLRRRHEPDRAVTMLLVVPAHQRAHPGARGEQGIERLERIGRPVLQGLEQRLGIRVVVAHAGRLSDGMTPSAWRVASIVALSSGRRYRSAGSPGRAVLLRVRKGL